MRMISGFERKTKQAAACLVLLAPTVAAWAQGVPVEDEDLDGVWGQAMFSVDNTAANGFDFTKITLNADVKLNSDFYNIQLGKVGTNPADVDIKQLSFVSSGVGGVDPYVKITDPYIQFVYKNGSDAANREIIGVRMGFGKIDGDLGLNINGLKGNITLTKGGDSTVADYGNLTWASSTTTPRGTSFACNTASAACGALATPGVVPMSQIGSVHSDSTSGSDFFISLLSQSVNFNDGSATAPDGVAVNWTKGVSYTNTTGTVLPNPLPSLAKRQGG